MHYKYLLGNTVCEKKHWFFLKIIIGTHNCVSFFFIVTKQTHTTDTFLFISHTTNVLLFKSRCNIFIGFRIIKEIPGLVGSGTPCINAKESCPLHTQEGRMWEKRYFFLWRCDPTRVMASSFTKFLDITQRRTTDGRTPLDEWSTRRRDLYLTTHDTHNRQTSMPPVGFEPTISADERPHTYALDRSATGTGVYLI